MYFFVALLYLALGTWEVACFNDTLFVVAGVINLFVSVIWASIAIKRHRESIMIRNHHV